MTIQEYKQQLYDACREHIFLAQQALDRYSTAKTDREREQARIDNIQHLAAYHALQWALDKAIDGEQQYFGGKLPKTPAMHYAQELVDYVLKQQQEEQMKTEQEIKQMANTCNQYHSCAACPYNPEDISRFIGDRWKGGCPNYDRKLVYAMSKGYGDVSEYKAEIERLKDDYVKLQEQFADYQMASDKEIRAQVKQAKIDVLNELKTHSYYDDDYMDGYVFVSDIDKLIDEVQNDERRD